MALRLRARLPLPIAHLPPFAYPHCESKKPAAKDLLLRGLCRSLTLLSVPMAAPPCRCPWRLCRAALGVLPTRESPCHRGAGLLGLLLSLCFPGSLLARLAMYCRRAPVSRPGPPLRSGWRRLGLARGQTAAA